MIAVPLAIDRSLNQASLRSEAWIELGQGPADGVAFSLVSQSVAFVLLLAHRRSRIDTVLRLEFLAEIVRFDGFNVTPDGVLHLDSISGILKSNPLYSVPVLTNH